MTSKPAVSCSVVLASKTSAIEGCCDSILSKLKSSDFSQDDIFAVHLALQEAFINALKHGNKMDPRKQIKVDYSVNAKKIEVFLTDEGDGFNPASIADPRCGENLYKSYGRGLFLIRSYMDVVEFSRRGNSVHMVKYKKQGQ
ncbi:MAG: ATP-binding protein [Sedimentisphaerales bacterium]|nr:ATP-binding protein [Sedimentisphaerales bacterium]